MKHTLLALALVAAAGAASAQTMPTQGSGNMSTDTPMNSGAQMKSGAAANGSGANMAPEMANAPRVTGAAATAQKRIEMDGYKNVTGLAKGSDGLWHGTAMRGNTQVQVTVDRAGRVAAQ
jgi:hypothetical protein